MGQFALAAVHELGGLLEHVGVEAAAQALVAGHHHQPDLLLLAGGEEGLGDGALDGVGVVLEAGHDAAHHLRHLVGVGAKGQQPLLGFPQLHRGDHLHGLGDLLGVLHRPDPAANVL